MDGNGSNPVIMTTEGFDLFVGLRVPDLDLSERASEDVASADNDRADGVFVVRQRLDTLARVNVPHLDELL